MEARAWRIQAWTSTALTFASWLAWYVWYRRNITKERSKVETYRKDGSRTKEMDPYDESPRKDYLSWEDYFMSLALLSSMRSKDPNRQVGAVIVSRDQVIQGIGYNGFPRGCSDQKFSWAKRNRQQDVLRTKYPYVVHAEVNAIMNKNSATVDGSKLYVTMFPCNECAKIIIQSGIKEVVVLDDMDDEERMHRSKKHTYEASGEMFRHAGIKISRHRSNIHVHVQYT